MWRGGSGNRNEKQGGQAAWGWRKLRKNSKGGLTVITRFTGSQMLEVKPEAGAETPHCGQRRSVERTLEGAREWGGERNGCQREIRWGQKLRPASDSWL